MPHKVKTDYRNPHEWNPLPMNKPIKPLRVAHVVGKMDSGGIEAVLMNYYRAIDRNIIQFDFYFDESSSIPQKEEILRLGGRIFPTPPYTQGFGYIRYLMDAFKQEGYGIVHSHIGTVSVLPLLAAKKAGVPVRICHSHTTAHWREWKKTLLKYLLRPSASWFATHYVACGQKVARWMYGSNSTSLKKVWIMPNAIDTSRFLYDASARREQRETLGIGAEDFVVGNVGRLCAQKNQAFLLNAFSALLRQRPESWLLVVGEGELQADLIQQAERLRILQRVLFLGVRTNVNKLYSAMDVFAQPSLYEGLSIVTLEAQANGLCCILSDTMTDERPFTDGTVMLPIKEKHIDHWASAILNARSARQTTLQNVDDIHKYARMLVDYYQKAMIEAGTK